MAKDNAQKCRDYRENKAKRQALLGEAEIKLPLPAGTRTALAELMTWHGHEDQREAISTMIHRVHEAGPAGSADFLRVSQHRIEISEKVLRQLESAGNRCVDSDREVSDVGRTSDRV